MIVDIGRHYCGLVIHSLQMRLQEVETEWNTLRKARNGDFTEVDRFDLPPNVIDFTIPQLAEQVEAWYSLKLDYEYLIKKFEDASE